MYFWKHHLVMLCQYGYLECDISKRLFLQNYFQISYLISIIPILLVPYSVTKKKFPSKMSIIKSANNRRKYSLISYEIK